MPPARKAIDSTLYRSDATVRLATATSGLGSNPANRMVMPADQASSIFMAQDAHASLANGRQSCTETEALLGYHE